ncbi:MAG TPA: hypothetical protein VEA17_08760, partial [Bordetella sp.]|nr:hypothetical protein [Bordetella sp.]
MIIICVWFVEAWELTVQKAFKDCMGAKRRITAAIKQALTGSVALYAATATAQTTAPEAAPITVLPAVTVSGAPEALGEAPAPI